MYKRTGGTTTNLHRHLQSNHPNKLDKEVDKNQGSMDKFVVNAIPVRFFFLIYINNTYK